jgi:hypothetical protein
MPVPPLLDYRDRIETDLECSTTANLANLLMNEKARAHLCTRAFSGNRIGGNGDLVAARLFVFTKLIEAFFPAFRALCCAFDQLAADQLQLGRFRPIALPPP